MKPRCLRKKNNYPNNYPGTLVVLEGPDGSGKTTGAKILQSVLEEKLSSVMEEKVQVEMTREPGGTPLAEKIRNLVLFHDDPQEDMGDATELYLIAAARAQHLRERVWPALRAGKLVICDRFSISTRVYQGHARQQLQTVMELEKLVHPDFQPDFTLFFDVDLQTSLDRLKSRDKGDRFESTSLSFKTRLFDGYQFEKEQLIKENPDLIKVIDANNSVEHVNSQLTSIGMLGIGTYFFDKRYDFFRMDCPNPKEE